MTSKGNVPSQAPVINDVPGNSNKRFKPSGDCLPIESVADLSGFLENPPVWINGIESLIERSPTCIQNKHLACHTVEGTTNISYKRLDRKLVPKTLICHDMKNGYLEDSNADSVQSPNGYTFYRWAQIDMFVYFSHHFITIPPLGWINVAHRNGVQILGTLITENAPGEKLCDGFLKDIQTMRTFANALVDLSVLLEIDGWLLNIENSLKQTNILIEFVRYLTDTIHKRKQGSVIIWYDSIIADGTLSWQNELNEKNKVFFDVCDGIFLNYVWKEISLRTSCQIAQHRLMDVYVGIDVFGRNTFGGGKFNCHFAAEKIRQFGMSIALFAPGWTHETLKQEPEDNFYERYLKQDSSFWRSLWPFLYTHPINRFFDTSFYTGSDKQFYKLNSQELQLSRFLSHDCEDEYSNEVVSLKNECGCLQLKYEDTNTYCLISKNESLVYIHNLFVCDIPVNGHIILHTFTKPLTKDGSAFLNVILLIQQNSSLRKICCNAVREQKPENNMTITNVYPFPHNISEKFYAKPKDSEFKSYHLKFNGNCRILQIMGELVNCNSVILCGIGLKQVRF